MQSNYASKVNQVAGVSIFIALVAVLQIVATFVRIGPFPLTLTLVPIIVGAAVYGMKAGALLGGAFGLVVVIMSVTGADPLAQPLFVMRPFVFVVIVMFRCIMAGFAAGLVFKIFSRKDSFVGVYAASIITPVVNTGIFLGTFALFYGPVLSDMATAAGVSVVYALFITLAGVNFLIEFGVNIVLSPTIKRIIDIRRKTAA